MAFAFEETPCISLGCKLVSVIYLECESDLFIVILGKKFEATNAA